LHLSFDNVRESLSKVFFKRLTKQQLLRLWNTAHNSPHFDVFNKYVTHGELPASSAATDSTYARLLRRLDLGTIETVKDVLKEEEAGESSKYSTSASGREWIDLPGPPRRITPLIETTEVEMGIEVHNKHKASVLE